MKLEFITPEHLTCDQLDNFWDQGIWMDDWDYLIIAPVTEITEHKDGSVECNNRCLNRLLNGPGNKVWHIAQWHGKPVAVGVVYHA